MPTATTYTAALAPTGMRGRCMSIFSLTWGVAQVIGPVAGGFLADTLSPAATWYGGGVSGMLAVSAFIFLALHRRRAEEQAAAG